MGGDGSWLGFRVDCATREGLGDGMFKLGAIVEALGANGLVMGHFSCSSCVNGFRRILRSWDLASWKPFIRLAVRLWRQAI